MSFRDGLLFGALEFGGEFLPDGFQLLQLGFDLRQSISQLLGAFGVR